MPFVFVTSVGMALAIATVLSLAGLFSVGVVKAYVAKTSRILSGLENMVVAGVGGLIAWGIGVAFGATVL
jgi:VIT1/CCC1 family predicted Fe2+/Mn2+ transporter